jgi:transcriptional regulator with XRE-family HTH domain
MPSTAKEIGQRLQRMHVALGIIPADVCRATGLSANRYSQYVNGDRRLTEPAAELICDATGVTLDWLFRGNEETLRFQILQKLRATAA